MKQKNYDIAVLGPPNTYSDLALKKYSKKAEAFYAGSITEVFEMVEKGKVKEGLIPIENTSGGSVRETLDELYTCKVWVEKVIAQPVHLALVGNEKIDPKKIKTLYSHSQPFLQSRHFIKKHCPKASQVPVNSTVMALERVIEESKPEVVAIASSFAAKAKGLVVIQNFIEDSDANTTYFALIRKTPKKITAPKAKKTSIAFHFKKDSPSSLYIILEIFARHKINLTKIESRPNPQVSGEYVFYIDFEKGIEHKKTQTALRELKSKVAQMKILGSY